VLLLDDRTAEGHDLQLQSIAHGVILMESVEREYGIKRRRLEVKKLRGSRFREGFHDYTIKRGGVEVYPRLVASEHFFTFTPAQLNSGLPVLDKLLGGDLDSGTSTLLLGPAGCGKSTIAVRYAVSAVEQGGRAALFAFDETLATLVIRQLHELLAYLSQKGITTLMTVAQHGFVGTNIDTPVDVSYLADTVLLFRYF
jgi:circadian clock protein KaiC